MGKIEVVKYSSANERFYRLRVELDIEQTGSIKFETLPKFTKPEADYRAILLSSRYGFNIDELPTHEI